MEDESATASTMDYIKGHSSEIVDHVSDYGYLIADSLYLIALGMLVVFLLHKLASKFLYPLVNNNRLLRVAFGALYLMVFVVTVLLALKHMGFQTSQLGSILLLVVILGAIIIYFLIPFFPKLPCPLKCVASRRDRVRPGKITFLRRRCAVIRRPGRTAG